MILKAEHLPKRCEICHQIDCFEPRINKCHRCINLELCINEFQEKENLTKAVPSFLNNRYAEILERSFTWLNMARSLFLSIIMGPIVSLVLQLPVLLSSSLNERLNSSFTCVGDYVVPTQWQLVEDAIFGGLLFGIFIGLVLGVAFSNFVRFNIFLYVSLFFFFMVLLRVVFIFL